MFAIVRKHMSQKLTSRNKRPCVIPLREKKEKGSTSEKKGRENEKKKCFVLSPASASNSRPSQCGFGRRGRRSGERAFCWEFSFCKFFPFFICTLWWFHADVCVCGISYLLFTQYFRSYVQLSIWFIHIKYIEISFFFFFFTKSFFLFVTCTYPSFPLFILN